MSNTKENILRVAIQRMQQFGIRSVSIDDICHEMGMSKKTFYVYFASKDELVEAILAIHENKVAHELEQAMQKRSIVQCITEWSKIAKHTEKSMVKTPPMIYDLEKYYPQLFAAHKKVMRAATERVVISFLKKGKDEGVFRSDLNEQVAAMMFMDIQYKLMAMVSDSKLNREEIRMTGHQSMDILMRGILTAEGLETIKKQIENNI